MPPDPSGLVPTLPEAENATEKIDKIEQLGDKVQRVDAKITKEPSARMAETSLTVELTVICRGPVVRAEASAADKFAAFGLTPQPAELVGAPPHRYLADARLKAAHTMLREGRAVTETCFACGYNNLSHFSRSFAKRFGMPPSRVAN